MSKNLQIAFLGDNYYPSSVEPRMVELLSKFYGAGYHRFYIKAESKCLLAALKNLKRTNHDLEINVYVNGFLAEAPTGVNLIYVTHEREYFDPR